MNSVWSPATINTATAATTTYTFTPTDASQCATTASISVTVTPDRKSVVKGVGPLCHNSTAPALPGTSNNGITGSWSPATINTATAGTINYTFTPTYASHGA